MPDIPKRKKRPYADDDAGAAEHREDRPDDNEEQKARRKEWKAVLDRYRGQWRALADDKDRNWSAWLLLRCTAADIGFRPIPSAQPFWTSPDIWVESSDPTGQPVAGKDNFVHARVFNLGKASAAPTRVDFYWADPSLGLGPANMHLIGTEWAEVLPHSARDVRCNTPWVPIFLNDGHECLMVNCNSAILDPITHPFQPQLDRHVGQRNVSVLKGDDPAYAMVLTVNNIFPFPARTLVGADVRNVHIYPERVKGLSARAILDAAVAVGQPEAALPDQLRRQYRAASAEHRQAVSGANFLAGVRSGGLASKLLSEDDDRLKDVPQVETKWSGDIRYVKPDAPNKYAGELLAGLDALASAYTKIDAGVGGSIILARDTFEPFEQRQLTVRVGAPPDPRRPTISVAHVQQWSAEYFVGGYTILGLTKAADELLAAAARVPQ